MEPPPESPYVSTDDDPDFREQFAAMPKGYVPNPIYKGTMSPGLEPENSPWQSLDWSDITEIMDDDAFFEVPFHLRWPTNGPYLTGPYDRIEIAGRFLSDEEIARRIKDPDAPKKKESKLQTLQDDDDDDDDEEEEDLEKDRDPVFDDKSSSLLDAALGLDDDDDDEIGPISTTTTKDDDPPSAKDPFDYLVD